MTITGSPDITSLEVQVTFDISGTNPVISLANLSTGGNLAGVQWWFAAYSPSNTEIHLGDVNNVDITGSWNTYTLTDSWPKPFKSIEWSGAPYLITIYAKDTNGTIFQITKSAMICRPQGNTPTSKTPYGLSNIYVKTILEQARIYFEDRTNASYKGVDGTRVASSLSVIYPVDETGNIPDPFRMTNFSNAMVPISYASDNYQFSAYSIYDYDFGDYVHVRVKYIQQKTFPVYADVDLGILSCEIAKIIETIETGSCQDIAKANSDLTLINGKLNLVFTGIIFPLTGIDVYKLIDEIKLIGGFACNCCGVSTGFLPETSSVIDGYTFSINPVGGDVGGTVTLNGTNIQFNLHGKSYVFSMYPGSPSDTTAFTISNSTSVDGYTKTYYLKVNANQLSEDIATAISNDADLLNLWQTLLGNGNGDFKLTVDGECIFESTSTCDYDFSFVGVPATTTYALLSGINIEGVVQSLSYSFNLTNLSALQAYLNSLGYGTFSVTQPGPNPSGYVFISTTANANDIQSITYKISGTTYIADLSKNCTGYVAISANEVVQNIINYLCALDDTKVLTSQDYIISYIDSTGDVAYLTVDGGTDLSGLIQALLDAGNTSISYLSQNGGGGGVTCASLKSVFTTNTLPLAATDFIYATKGSACSPVGFLEAFNYMLQSGYSNATTKQLFCDFVASCGQGLVCAPYNYLEAYVTDYDYACSQIIGLEYSIS